MYYFSCPAARVDSLLDGRGRCRIGHSGDVGTAPRRPRRTAAGNFGSIHRRDTRGTVLCNAELYTSILYTGPQTYDHSTFTQDIYTL